MLTKISYCSLKSLCRCTHLIGRELGESKDCQPYRKVPISCIKSMPTAVLITVPHAKATFSYQESQSMGFCYNFLFYNNWGSDAELSLMLLLKLEKKHTNFISSCQGQFGTDVFPTVHCHHTILFPPVYVVHVYFIACSAHICYAVHILRSCWRFASR